MAWEGLDPDPINIKKNFKHLSHFTKDSFLQFFAFFPPARALCEEKHPQTMKIWWPNYENLVAYYENLVAFGGVL